MSAYPGFVGGAYASQNPVSANESLVNWLVEVVETPGGTARTHLVPTPGFKARVSFPTAGGRGAWAGDGRCFVVVGNTLYEVFADYTYLDRGTVAIDQNPATICTNGDGGGQLFVTSGGKGYTFDLGTNTLTEVLSSGVLMGGMLYGYFIAFGNAQIRISDLFDGLTWDPTQFAQRTVGSDLWQAMLVNPYGYLLLPGSKTGEFWYNANSFPFPFAPDNAGFIEEGIAAPFSLKQAGKSMVWLSTNANGGYQVMRAQGFTPERISDHALERALAGYGDVSGAIGETYEREGHAYYLLSIPSARVTWCYDFTTSQKLGRPMWHRRGTWEPANNSYSYARAVHQCFAFSRYLALDRGSNVLYEMSDAYATDVDGVDLVRERVTPATTDEDGMVFFDNLRLQMQTGVGVPVGRDEDVTPLITLQYSNDFGRTWSKERAASVGASGAYDTRAEWWCLGAGRGRVYRVRCSAAVPYRITNAFQKIRRSREAA